MLNVRREYRILASKDDFVKHISEQIEPVKSFRFAKYRSTGGNSILGGIEGNDFRLYPNTVITEFSHSVACGIFGNLTGQKGFLTIRIRFTPPVWVSVLLLASYLLLMILFDFKWYGILIFSFLICAHLINLNQRQTLLKELERFISQFPKF